MPHPLGWVYYSFLFHLFLANNINNIYHKLNIKRTADREDMSFNKLLLTITTVLLLTILGCGITKYNYYSFNTKDYELKEMVTFSYFNCFFSMYYNKDITTNKKEDIAYFDISCWIGNRDKEYNLRKGIDFSKLQLDSIILDDTLSLKFHKLLEFYDFNRVTYYEPVRLSNDIDSLAVRIFITYPMNGELISSDTTAILYHHKGKAFYID